MIVFTTKITWIVVGKSCQEILIPIWLGLQMHLTQTTEHLWRQKNVGFKIEVRGSEGKTEIEPSLQWSHLNSWWDTCYIQAPSLDRSDNSILSKSPPRQWADCRWDPRQPARNIRLCVLQYDLDQKGREDLIFLFSLSFTHNQRAEVLIYKDKMHSVRYIGEWRSKISSSSPGDNTIKCFKLERCQSCVTLFCQSLVWTTFYVEPQSIF